MGPFVFSTNHKLEWKVPSQIWTPIYNLTQPTHPKYESFSDGTRNTELWLEDTEKRSHPRSGLLPIGTKRPYFFTDPNTIKYKGRALDYFLLFELLNWKQHKKSTWDFFLTWDLFEAEWPPTNSLKPVEYIWVIWLYIWPCLIQQLIKSYVLLVLIRYKHFKWKLELFWGGMTH